MHSRPVHNCCEYQPDTQIITDLWCTSPKHRYFCTKDIHSPDLTLFLIPFTEVIHLIERKKLLDGLAKYSKLREL